MKKHMGFFESIHISIFEFKSYIRFIDIPFLRVFLNRVIFLLIISIAITIFSIGEINFIKNIDLQKETIFQDISYSDGVLNISNSPTVFEDKSFILIGDTRDNVDISDINNKQNLVKSSVVLLKDSFIIRHKNKENKINYTDIPIFSTMTLDKNNIFLFLNALVSSTKYLVFVVFPIYTIVNYFLLAFITSILALFVSIIMRVKLKFSQVYKMILFAQGPPFLVISIFEIISTINNVQFVFPANILEMFTILIFIISLFSIKREQIKKAINNKK